MSLEQLFELTQPALDGNLFKPLYPFKFFKKFVNQDSITLDAWESLLLTNPGASQVHYFLIAPMLEKTLGHPPASLDELDEAWHRIHDNQWPADVLILLFRFATLVKKDLNFINQLSKENSRVFSNNLTKSLDQAFRYVDDTIKSQLINKIEPDAINLEHTQLLPFEFKHLSPIIQLALFNKLGIHFLITCARYQSDTCNEENHAYLFKYGQTAEEAKQFMFSSTLVSFINGFDKQTLRLPILQQIPQETISEAIYDYSRLIAFLSLFDEENRMELSRTLLKESIGTTKFKPYELARVLEIIPANDRITWIADALTWEKFAEIKKDPHWKEFKRLFTKEEWSEIRAHLYPGEELKMHSILKSIRTEFESNTLLNFDIIRGNTLASDASYPLVHMTRACRSAVIASPPIAEQVRILYQAGQHKIRPSQALEQITAIGQATHESLSQPDNPHRLFYSSKGLAFFKAFSSVEARDERFAPQSAQPAS